MLLLFFSCNSFLALSQNDDALDSIFLEVDLTDIIVTAQYAPNAVENAVHQVKVIKAADIQREGQNNLAEVLTNQLNLRVSNDPILGNGLRIQGIGGENIQVMIDGVPVVGRLGGNIDLSQINLHNIKQIEIIEGAMSAQYGSNAAGGVINLITKKSQLQPFTVRNQTQYEDIGIFNNALSLGAQLDKWYLSVSMMNNRSSFASVDSLRLMEEVKIDSLETLRRKVNPWNPKLQTGFDASVRYNFNDSTQISYQYRDFEEKLRRYGEQLRPRFKPYAFDEYYTTRRKDHQLGFEAYLGSYLYLNTTTGYNEFERKKQTYRLDFDNDSTSVVTGGQDTTNFTALLHRTVLSTVTNRALNGQLGIEYLGETGVGKRIVDTTSLPINASDLANYAIWGSLQYEWRQLKLQANLRYGYNTKYDHPLIPSLNLKWDIDSNWKINASYAHGFRAPSLKELYFRFIDINHYIIGNAALRPEHSRNASLGIQYKTLLGGASTLSGKLKFFYNKIEDRIVLSEFAPVQFQYDNVADFETHGLNAALLFTVDRYLEINTGLAYTRLYNAWSESFDADRFRGLYEMQNNLRLKLPRWRSALFLTHRFIGRQIRFYTDGDNNLQEGFIGGYHLVNLSLSREFLDQRILLVVGSKNLLDTQRVPLGGESNATHSGGGNSQLLNWGRSYYIRLNLNF